MSGALILHSMWRATAPYRVRIALALKGLAFDYAPVNLTAGEQSEDGGHGWRTHGIPHL